MTVKSKIAFKTAVYAGTFDPVTNGHLDIITRARALYAKVIIAVSDHDIKKPAFSLKVRIKAIQEVTKHLDGIEVLGFSGLLCAFANQKNADVLIRGLRMTSDFDYEFQMAEMNRSLPSGFETVFLMARPEFSTISSTTIRGAAALGGDVSKFVPLYVQTLLKKNYKSQK